MMRQDCACAVDKQDKSTSGRAGQGRAGQGWAGQGRAGLLAGVCIHGLIHHHDADPSIILASSPSSATHLNVLATPHPPATQASKLCKEGVDIFDHVTAVVCTHCIRCPCLSMTRQCKLSKKETRQGHVHCFAELIMK